MQVDKYTVYRNVVYRGWRGSRTRNSEHRTQGAGIKNSELRTENSGGGDAEYRTQNSRTQGVRSQERGVQEYRYQNSGFRGRGLGFYFFLLFAKINVTNTCVWGLSVQNGGWLCVSRPFCGSFMCWSRKELEGQKGDTLNLSGKISEKCRSAPNLCLWYLKLMI